MTTAMKQSLESERAALIYFYEFSFSLGPVRLCSAAQDVTATISDASGTTWTAVGGLFEFEPITESTDLNAAQVKLKLSGVDQTMIGLVLNNGYVGRSCQIWLGHRDPDTLVLVSNPVLLFRGYQNGGWSIEEERSDGGGPQTANVSLRAIDRLSDLEQRRGIQTNTTSHQAFSPGDRFFEFVPQLLGKSIKWGTL
jgi:hypothetical protein